MENIDRKNPLPNTGPDFTYTHVMYVLKHRLPTRENAAEQYIPVLSRRWPRAG